MTTFIGIGIVLLVFFLFVFTGLRTHRADWGTPWLNVIDGWLRIYCRLVHHFRHDPLILPETGAALLVSNHVSGLDPFLMIAAAPRPLRFIIAREQFERFGMKWLFRAAGCIPVDRARHPQQAFREALARLRDGEVVALFPGGHIHIPGEPPPRLKRGVARLAKLSGVPVYPVRVTGMRGHGHVVRSIFLPSHSRLTVFERFDCSAAGEQNCLQHLAEVLNNADGGSTTQEAPS